MRKNFFIILACFSVLIGMISGCKDKEVPVPSINMSEVTPVVDRLNANIVALKKLIEMSTINGTINSCTPFTDGTGYNIIFSDGTNVSVYTQIGYVETSDKESSYTPMTGAKTKGGVAYYWSLDRNWLLADDNQYISVDTEELIPQIGINENGNWKVTVGSSERELQKVEEGNLLSVFKSVLTDNESGTVTFEFSDWTSSITLSLYSSEGKPVQQIPTLNQLRRPVSPTQPMWLVHIDSWCYPDPQKIIELIPDDVLPYVVFNISVSAMWEEGKGWKNLEYGYETLKSWLRTCAENNVWAVVQPSSGGYSHFPDYEDYAQMEASVYGEFYREYPNFIGFNYCEQFYGFGIQGVTPSRTTRLKHLANLIKLSHKYGGYMIYSWCNTQYGSAMNPIGILKGSSEMESMCGLYPENVIMCEKYTAKHGFNEMESVCLGSWLSGYSGQYGIRMDSSSWRSASDGNSVNGDTEYPEAAGTLPTIEHIMLTGQTVVDGPELIWQQCFTEGSTVKDGEYTKRQWVTFPQFENISLDFFRKILDGTIRILSRDEVIERTKLLILNEKSFTGSVNTVSDTDARKYFGAPDAMYNNLYRMPNDGQGVTNYNYFKLTGRYPSIPVAWKMNTNNPAGMDFETTRRTDPWNWDNKVNDMNAMFPEVSTGSLYVGRQENTLVVCNGHGEAKSGTIPLKYNTCSEINLELQKYSIGVIHEFNDRIKMYITNYSVNGTKVVDKFVVKGCDVKPTYTFKDRGSHDATTITESWSNGTYKLAITHNGPLDLEVNCKGSATGRETKYTVAQLSVPVSPLPYVGVLQYEAENFDYNGGSIIKKGISGDIRNYTAVGYLKFGKAVREIVTVPNNGFYIIRIKYNLDNNISSALELYVNNRKYSDMDLAKSSNPKENWNTVDIKTFLNKGKNTIELRTDKTITANLYLDNIELILTD